MPLSIEVPSNAERAITGYALAVIYQGHGVTYRIESAATGAVRSATRNGQPVSMERWPASVVKQMARTAANFLPIPAPLTGVGAPCRPIRGGTPAGR